jgi:hypothetical protein
MRSTGEPISAGRRVRPPGVVDRGEALVGPGRLERVLATAFFGGVALILGVVAVLWIEFLVWLWSWIASFLASVAEAPHPVTAGVREAGIRWDERFARSTMGV